jgi:hypothetical protein
MRNASRRVASKLPELAGAMAASRRRPSPPRRCNASQPKSEDIPMMTDRPDPNAELATREPLRIAFAVAALLLGVLAMLH